MLCSADADPLSFTNRVRTRALWNGTSYSLPRLDGPSDFLHGNFIVNSVPEISTVSDVVLPDADPFPFTDRIRTGSD